MITKTCIALMWMSIGLLIWLAIWTLIANNEMSWNIASINDNVNDIIDQWLKITCE